MAPYYYFKRLPILDFGFWILDFGFDFGLFEEKCENLRTLNLLLCIIECY